jgi:SAM-dependent methyltransferase
MPYKVDVERPNVLQQSKGGVWIDIQKFETPPQARRKAQELNNKEVVVTVEEPSMKVSVVVATYNRADLLNNALIYYAQQTLPFEDWEYILIDDMSTDDTMLVVNKWINEGLPIRCYTSEQLGKPKEPGKWRDGCPLRNAGSTWAHGEVMVFTHPEIIPPVDALEKMYFAVKHNPEKWITAIPYWLPGTANLGKLKKWKTDLHALREVDGFYLENWAEGTVKGIDYTNNNQERRMTWESEVFWAMDTHLWRWAGGFREFEVWGSVDMDFMHRRNAMKIPTIFATSDLSPHAHKVLMVYHQDHGSERDMDKALAAMPKGTYSMQTAREAGGLYAVYEHGHRERPTGGNLNVVLEDHKARYRFANIFANAKKVLDIPCGTGYGSELLVTAASYLGVDIDEETIRYASQYFGKNRRIFKAGDMRKCDIPDNSIELLLSFEGIEHLDTLDDQKAFVAEMHRVIKPGSTFILSTPRKGGAAGTPWDVSILEPEELIALFDEEKWGNLDWYYQMSYGSTELPKLGYPPPNAQIMILGGTKK